MEDEYIIEIDEKINNKIIKQMESNLFKRLKLELKKSNIESSKDYLCQLKNSKKNILDVCKNIINDNQYKNDNIILTCTLFIDLFKMLDNNHSYGLNEITKMFYMFHYIQHLYGKKYLPDYKIISTNGSIEDFRKIFNYFLDKREVK